VREEVWCLKCKIQGHDKDHCPVFTNYVVAGGPIPLRPDAQARPSAEPTLWCAICQVAGKHMIFYCHLLQKFVQTPQQHFCNFCKSVGHDECNYHSYELMMDITLAYWVHGESRPPDQGVGGAQGKYQGCGRGQGGGEPGRDQGQVIYYNCGGPGHYVRDCPNLMHMSCRYCT